VESTKYNWKHECSQQNIIGGMSGVNKHYFRLVKTVQDNKQHHTISDYDILIDVFKD